MTDVYAEFERELAAKLRLFEERRQDTASANLEAETAELASFTKTAMSVLRAVSGAQGFNIGMNMGSVAGAGIAAHLHQHIVPRWGGDANFMPVIGHTKVLPQLLADTRDMLAGAWPHTS